MAGLVEERGGEDMAAEWKGEKCGAGGGVEGENGRLRLIKYTHAPMMNDLYAACCDTCCTGVGEAEQRSR